MELLLFFITLFLLFLVFRKKRSPKKISKVPDVYVPHVRKKQYFFTRNERLLYDCLYRIIHNNEAYDLFSKVRWEDVWTAIDWRDRGYIRSRHIDFVIFSRKTGEIVMVVELHGQEHYTNQKRIERDSRLEWMCINTHTKLPVIRSRKEYSHDAIKGVLNKCIASKDTVHKY